MRVRVFGKDSDDKGAQLEQLTQRLLERRGYRQITLNFVGSGGSEIDIRAEYAVPSLNRENVVHLIGECKAYEATVAMPDWLKFLGKLYTEKASRRQDLRGLFVALSGVNGNVRGAYEDLRNQDSSVELISGDDLVAQVLDEFKLPQVSQLFSRVAQLTADVIAATSLGYYQSRAFWIAEFANSTFTVLCGESLEESPAAELVAIVSGQIQAAKFRDLSQEQIAKNRLALARKYVLGQLLTNRPIDLPEQENFFPPTVPVSQADVDAACTELRAEGKMFQQATTFRLADVANDLSVRAAIICEILTGICILSHLAAPEWEALIDDDLLAESLRVKDALTIADVDRSAIVQLMKWSPTGLLWSLSKDEVLCGHRGKLPQVDEILAPDHARYYRLQMLGFAIDDFRGAAFSAMLHERYGLRELEFTRRALFKSQKQVELEMTVTDRTRIARYEPTGGLVHVWLTEHAPEPWSTITPDSAESASGNGQGHGSHSAPNATPRHVVDQALGKKETASE